MATDRRGQKTPQVDFGRWWIGVMSVTYGAVIYISPKTVARKIDLPNKSKIKYIFIEPTTKTPLMIPLISKIKKNTYYIVVINKGELGLNVATLEKSVKAFNLSVINDTSVEIKPSFANKIHSLNMGIENDKYKIKY